MRIPTLSRLSLLSASAAALLLSCSHDAAKPDAASTAAAVKAPESAAVQQGAAEKAAAEKLAAERFAAQKAEADKAAEEQLHLAKLRLHVAVASLPEVPALPALPHGIAKVEAPADNPLTAEKVALGQQLFFDKRLSKDGSMSCESCHHIAQAYTSGNALDTKVGGKVNVRNAPTMTNLGYHANGYYWDGRKPTLEAVTQAAWAGQLGADPAAVPAALNAILEYRALFERAFASEATAQNIPQALASFLRALTSGDSAWEKFEAGDKKAVSKDAIAGAKLFTSKGCVQCHIAPLYTDTMFHNVGIGWDASKKAFADHGRMDATKDAADDGKFKTPTLRDAAKTGPYFHDGSAKTLADAIEIMSNGGVANPTLDAKLKPAKLNKKERAQLEAFISSLSGNLSLGAAPTLP